MKKILLIFFINIPFFISSSVQQKNKIMYADIVINEMRTRLAFEKQVDDIICYQGVDSQGNTIIHTILIDLVKKFDSKNNNLRDDINLLNKLSKYFSAFKNKKNSNQKTPFDIIFEGGRCINIAGSIQNFKDLLPTEKINIDEKKCQKQKSEKRNKATLVASFMPAESKAVLAVSSTTERNNFTHLFYEQPPVYMKKNMGILFEYESLN